VGSGRRGPVDERLGFEIRGVDNGRRRHTSTVWPVELAVIFSSSLAPLVATVKSANSRFVSVNPILLKNYWVLEVMDQFTRRIIFLAVHAGGLHRDFFHPFFEGFCIFR